MALSEKELLLLDCFMYTNKSVKTKPYNVKDFLALYTDENGIVQAEKLTAANFSFSGDMDADKMADVMNQMLASEELMQLTVVDTINDGIRAACFRNEETGETTVAFRGTGGSYGQWYDNLEGYGELSTEAQRKASEFINRLPYDNMTVTGHSKGGNLAMYVTIVHADKIDRCVSYEGQGFSKEFCDEYADRIEDAKRKGKITSISAYNDPVHGLLIPIATEEHFVHSDSWPFSHGGYSILSAEDNSFDENGNFTQDSYCNEATVITEFGEFTEELSQYSNTPIVGPVIEIIADIAGVAAGLFFDQKWEDAWTTIKKAWKDFKKYITEDVTKIVDGIIHAVEKFKDKLKKLIHNGGGSKADPQLIVDTYKLDKYAERIWKVQERIVDVDGRLDALYLKVEIKDLWNLLKADLLTGFSLYLTQCANYLSNTAADFRNVEKDLPKKLQ